ncbi:MAG TPA: PQQ-binding-like beta-propeller repeat protein [Caldisericia bacterium]|nr:PQQ-binding-like beta-propeller repeat protein [Caldisericia bacterium]
MLKSKVGFLVIIFAFSFANLSCKPPNNTPLQKNLELELKVKQEEEMSPEKKTLSTEELFRWKKHLGDRAEFSSKSIHENQLFYYANGSIVGINLENGEEIWKETLLLEGSFHEILFKDTMLFIRTVKDSYDYLSAWNIKTKEKSWSQKMDHPNHSTVTLYEDMILYGSFSGFIYALDANNGSLRWRFSFEEAVGKGFYPQQHTEDIKSYRSSDITPQGIEDYSINLSSELWIMNGVLYCYYNGDLPNYYPDNKGLIYAIDLSTQSLQWKALLPEIITSDILFESHQDYNMLYVGTWKSMYEIDSRTGEFIEIPVESLGITKALVGLTKDFFVIKEGSFVYWVSRSDHTTKKREYGELQSLSGWMPLWYRNVTQILINNQSYQDIVHDVLIISNCNRSLVMLDLNIGEIIFHWINTNARSSEGWVDAFQHQDIFIASDGFGIYALDFKKVFLQWLDTKEKIEIVTGRE